VTISTSNTKDQINGNGSATSFNYNFKIFKEGDLEVIKTSASGVDSVLTLGTDYTVSGVGNESGSIVYPLDTYDAEGNLVPATPISSNEKITIRRKMDFIQTTDLQNQGSFFAEVHESAFDSLAMYSIQSKEEIARSLKAPITETSDLTLPKEASRRGKVLGFNETTGEPEMSASLSDISTLSSMTSDISTVASNQTQISSVYTNMSDINNISNNMTTLLDTVDQLNDLKSGMDENELLSADSSGGFEWVSEVEDMTLNGGYF